MLSSVQSSVGQLSAGFKAVERELPFASEDPSDPFLCQMTEFMFRKEEFDQLNADTKTMEVRSLTRTHSRSWRGQRLMRSHVTYERRRTSSRCWTRSARALSARRISSSQA
jgi:hypothetical protein